MITLKTYSKQRNEKLIATENKTFHSTNLNKVTKTFGLEFCPKLADLIKISRILSFSYTKRKEVAL